jgi:hypothetical protein
MYSFKYNTKLKTMIFEQFTNEKLKKIVNVYKKNSASHKTYGFGDYLRGCFFLCQICNHLNIEFDMDIYGHPISKYISNIEKKYDIDYIRVPYFNDMNLNYLSKQDASYKVKNIEFYNKVIKYLNSIDNEIFFLECNTFPIWKNINEKVRDTIKSKILPSKEMQSYIDVMLYKTGLEKYKFSVIHLRTGDKYLIDKKSISENMIITLKNVISKYTNPSLKYLIIGDDNRVKVLLKKFFSNLYCYVLPITHLGESIDQCEDTLKNTMLDFFILSYSNVVISISCLHWGSGFAEWSSQMNNIPYKYYMVNLES